jgi:hypothetical protein
MNWLAYVTTGLFAWVLYLQLTMNEMQRTIHDMKDRKNTFDTHDHHVYQTEAISAVYPGCTISCRMMKGYDGVNGSVGAQGPIGKSGMNGFNGTNGVNGVNGTNGANGINGTNGVSSPLLVNAMFLLVAGNGVTVYLPYGGGTTITGYATGFGYSVPARATVKFPVEGSLYINSVIINSGYAVKPVLILCYERVAGTFTCTAPLTAGMSIALRNTDNVYMKIIQSSGACTGTCSAIGVALDEVSVQMSINIPQTEVDMPYGVPFDGAVMRYFRGSPQWYNQAEYDEEDYFTDGFTTQYTPVGINTGSVGLWRYDTVGTFDGVNGPSLNNVNAGSTVNGLLRFMLPYSGTTSSVNMWMGFGSTMMWQDRVVTYQFRWRIPILPSPTNQFYARWASMTSNQVVTAGITYAGIYVTVLYVGGRSAVNFTSCTGPGLSQTITRPYSTVDFVTFTIVSTPAAAGVPSITFSMAFRDGNATTTDTLTSRLPSTLTNVYGGPQFVIQKIGISAVSALSYMFIDHYTERGVLVNKLTTG